MQGLFITPGNSSSTINAMLVIFRSVLQWYVDAQLAYPPRSSPQQEIARTIMPSGKSRGYDGLICSVSQYITLRTSTAAPPRMEHSRTAAHNRSR